MKTGIVGFFDILGYQNIIDNNEIEKTINIISDIIVRLPAKVRTIQAKVLSKWSGKIENQKIAEFILENNELIESVIISDSILITLPVDEDRYKEGSVYYWLIFLMYSCMLLEESFNNGLPLRGAIDYGQYYKKEQCLAGKTIINGYRFSNQLEFSGCALCKDAYGQIKALKDYDYDVIGSFLFEYLAPLKNNIEEKQMMLNWIVERAQKGLYEVRQYVFEAFHAHNKDVNGRAVQKLNNTENILRYCFLINKERQGRKIKI